MRKMLPTLVMLIAFVVGSASAASASPIGPVFPAPGGVAPLAPCGVPGCSGLPGGRTFNFTLLDPSQFADLYWGVWDGAFPGAALDGSINGAPEVMSFSGLSGNVATWIGTTNWDDPDTAPTTTTPVTTMLQITLLSGGTWVDAATLGLNPALGYVVDVAGAAFSTNILFSAKTANNFSTFIPINTVEQGGAPQKTQTSFSGAFYYEPVSVPDGGGTLILLSLAMAGVATAKRRFF